MGVPPVLFGRAGRPSHFPCGSYLILIPNLRLVEVNNNIAEAEAVPEPSTLLGTAIFLGLLVKRRKLNNKLSQVQSKV